MSCLKIAKSKFNGLVHRSKKTIKKAIMKATHIRNFKNSLPCGSIIPAALLSKPAMSFVHIERAFRIRYMPFEGSNKSSENFGNEHELSVEERLRQILQVHQGDVNIDFVTIVEEYNDIHGNDVHKHVHDMVKADFVMVPEESNATHNDFDGQVHVHDMVKADFVTIAEECNVVQSDLHGGFCLDGHEDAQGMVKNDFVTVATEGSIVQSDLHGGFCLDGHEYVKDMVKNDFVTVLEENDVTHNESDGEACLNGHEHVQDMVNTDFVTIVEERNEISGSFRGETYLDLLEKKSQDMVKTDFVTIADENNDIRGKFHGETYLDLQENVQDFTSPDGGSSERQPKSDYRFFHDVGSTPVTFESIEEITQAYFDSKKKFPNRNETLRTFGGKVMASRGLGHNRRESGDIFVAGMLEDMAADLARENDNKEDVQDLDHSVIYDDENSEDGYATQLDLRSICFSATAMGIYNEEVIDPINGNEHHSRVIYYDDDEVEDERSDEERDQRAVSRPDSAMGFYDDDDETDFVKPTVAVTIDEQDQSLEALVPTVTTMYSSTFSLKKRRPRFPRYVRKVSEPVSLNTIYEIDPEEEYEEAFPEDQGAYFSEDSSSEYSYSSDYESEETLVENKTSTARCLDFCEDKRVDLSTLNDEELMKYLFGRPTIPVYENTPIVFCPEVFVTEDNDSVDNQHDVEVQVFDPERLSPCWLPRATQCQ